MFIVVALTGRTLKQASQKREYSKSKEAAIFRITDRMWILISIIEENYPPLRIVTCPE